MYEWQSRSRYRQFQVQYVQMHFYVRNNAMYTFQTTPASSQPQKNPSTTELRLPHKGSAEESKEHDYNQEAKALVGGPAVAVTDDFRNGRVELVDEVQTLSHTGNNSIDITAIVEIQPQTATEELLHDSR